MKIKRIRKLKRKKKYNPNVNRKRLRNKLRKLPDIPCNEIKKEWEYKRSTRVNLKEMGLAYDANEAMQLPNVKHELLEGARRDVAGCEDSSDHEEMNVAKSHVAETLEAEAKAPRQRLLKLPKAQTQFLTYLIKKYGEDYEAMSRDRKNHYQLTWKQIRAKIKMFKRIPEQYNELAQNSDEQLVS
ncbi:PREDICTED: nucleolar protein 16 [Vollenhovia emeryi]|uniref:nucleolar protein 16 n=1 Tax=Vollenhovia emeryi TaxID=411798 RepID=UPI0005F43D4C|nr:PREDICTED: nucleolar protein 16 [Vollenhovia emeryi]